MSDNFYMVSHRDAARALMGEIPLEAARQPVSPVDAALMLTFPATWRSLLASEDSDYVREVLGTALACKGTTQILVQRHGADALRAATLRCYPNSLPGEALRLHHFAAKILQPETLKYLVEDVGGFPADERTEGPGRMSLLHLAAMAGDDDLPPALQERRLACLRYLVEEQGLSPVVTDARGLRPADFMEPGESAAAARRFLREAADATDATGGVE